MPCASTPLPLPKFSQKGHDQGKCLIVMLSLPLHSPLLLSLDLALLQLFSPPLPSSNNIKESHPSTCFVNIFPPFPLHLIMKKEARDFTLLFLLLFLVKICLDYLSLPPPLPLCLVMKKPIPCFVRIQLELFSLPLTLP